MQRNFKIGNRVVCNQSAQRQHWGATGTIVGLPGHGDEDRLATVRLDPEYGGKCVTYYFYRLDPLVKPGAQLTFAGIH